MRKPANLVDVVVGYAKLTKDVVDHVGELQKVQKQTTETLLRLTKSNQQFIKSQSGFTLKLGKDLIDFVKYAKDTRELHTVMIRLVFVILLVLIFRDSLLAGVWWFINLMAWAIPNVSANFVVDLFIVSPILFVLGRLSARRKRDSEENDRKPTNKPS